MFYLIIFLGVEIFSIALYRAFLPNFWGSVLLVIFVSSLGGLIATLFVTYFGDFLRSVQKNNNKMLRLENLSHPLLLKLSKNAPGTYSHSLTVAELAIFAGKKINIDTSYLRLGGYYHDIGKLHNPNMFLENKMKPLKLMDKKELVETAKAIIAHVPEGVKLAKEYELPGEIIEVICQHHGNAGIDSLKTELDKMDVRLEYPGPKPLSKETAVIMLADTIDARIRGAKFQNEESLAKTINAEIDRKINSEQLNLSGLKQKDIDTLRQAYLEKIQSLYHNRKFYKS